MDGIKSDPYSSELILPFSNQLKLEPINERFVSKCNSIGFMLINVATLETLCYGVSIE
jgi:hypothetical protein